MQLALTRVLHVGRPESEVVAEELHDEGRVLVTLFRESIELSNSIVERLLRQVAGAVGAVEDLVVEDGEVERKTKTDRVCWWELSDSNVGSSLVRLQGLVCALLALVASGELGEVTVVVTHPNGRNRVRNFIPTV